MAVDRFAKGATSVRLGGYYRAQNCVDTAELFNLKLLEKKLNESKLHVFKSLLRGPRGSTTFTVFVVCMRTEMNHFSKY